MSFQFSTPSDTRLVTIIAHVDHGKTTLADNLIESNGIISERLAGSLRYLDSLEEEQRRGITMKSSAIALKHNYVSPMAKKTKEDDSTTTTKTIHLIDSPGHVDFGSEVTSSLLACDGALVVVDVVEGMCARTQSVLRESFKNELVPVLVVNKIDRLRSDLNLTPTEAYLRIRSLIESINAAAAAMILNDKAEQKLQQQQQQRDLQNSTKNDKRQSSSSENDDDDDDEQKERLWNFDPALGNVVFCSALHGWGFTIPHLARSLYKQQILPQKPMILKQALFNDVYYNSQSQKIMKWKQSQSTQQQSTDDEDDLNSPMFAKYALKPIWNIYEGIDQAVATVKASSSSQPKITTVTHEMNLVLKSLQIGCTNNTQQQNTTIPTSLQELQTVLNRAGVSSSNEEGMIRALLRRYRPLSQAVLDTICDICPSPIMASSSIRSKVLTLQSPLSATEEETSSFENVANAVKECSIDQNAPSVAHVCKFVSIRQGDVFDPSHTSSSSSSVTSNVDPNQEELFALSRVLSGTLHDNMEYCVVNGNATGYDDPLSVKQNVNISLYLFMGASLVKTNQVSAGHICAIGGLSEFQWKTMTLCDMAHCSSKGIMPLKGFSSTNRPLVKVNVEPVRSSETDILERGLLKLALADAAVEVTASAKGERLLACRGELHLEQCILELQKKYCSKPIELRISEPIAEFGESTEWFSEEGDFETFLLSKPPPLRQTTIPPYCFEEGIQQARLGRCRTLLTGQSAALWLRVVPLKRTIYDCVKNKTTFVEQNDNTEQSTFTDDLIELGKALGWMSSSSSNEDSTLSLLKRLHQCVQHVDNLGNCFIESMGIRNGQCIMGTVTNEVYKPNNETTTGKYNVDDNDKKLESGDEEEEEEHALTEESSRRMYMQMTQTIKEPTEKQQPQNDDNYTDNGNDSTNSDAKNVAACEIYHSYMKGSLVGGFQLATRSGPFCEEPLRGVMVILEGVEIALMERDDIDGGVLPIIGEGEDNTSSTPSSSSSKHPTHSYVPSKPISGGMVVACVKQGIRCALLSRPARIVEAHVRLTLHTSLGALGNLYDVLNKRRGKVLADEMVDGTDLILITANLPQQESFGLASELLKKTSGEVTAPELIFSHYEILQEDPFWTPTTADEIEEFGQLLSNGQAPSSGKVNNALRILRQIRHRKGLLVDSKRIVVAAEKQRTLARKK